MTEDEALALAIKAVEIYAGRHPRPPHVTITQAAAMIGRSRPTTSQILKHHRVKLNSCGQIPIEEIDKLLASRT